MNVPEGKTRIQIVTNNHIIKGEIDLLPNSRVTDYIVEAKDFIALTNARVTDIENREILSKPFINVSREHIIIICPD